MPALRCSARQTVPRELLLDSNNLPHGSAARNRDSVREQGNSLAHCSGFAARESASKLQEFPQKSSSDRAAQAQPCRAPVQLPCFTTGSQDTKRTFPRYKERQDQHQARTFSPADRAVSPCLLGHAYGNTHRARREASRKHKHFSAATFHTFPGLNTELSDNSHCLQHHDLDRLFYT